MRSLLKEGFPRIKVTCADIPRLMELMAHDKKNASAGRPNFSLLLAVGLPEIDCVPNSGDIESALDIYRDMMC